MRFAVLLVSAVLSGCATQAVHRGEVRVNPPRVLSELEDALSGFYLQSGAVRDPSHHASRGITGGWLFPDSRHPTLSIQHRSGPEKLEIRLVPRVGSDAVARKMAEQIMIFMKHEFPDVSFDLEERPELEFW